MIKCSFKIPVKSWKFENDIWDYMTLESWLVCRGRYCKHFKGFENDLNTKLNKISARGIDFVSVWYTEINEDDRDLTVEYYTSNENITLLDFLDLIHNNVFPIFNSIESMGESLIFSDKYFNKFSFKIEFTDETFQSL